jgi:DNA-binding NarL/FixJ family response regulator
LFDSSAAGQYSVRIAQEGTGSYFPLGTNDEKAAAAQASLIFRRIQQKGWSSALQQFPREFTLALFWCNNPLLCTYATLRTHPGKDPELPQAPPDPTLVETPVRVAIIEADAQVSHALAHWANRLPGCACVGSFSAADPGTLSKLRTEASLILFNRSQADLRPEECPPGETLTGEPSPTMPFVPYGIYETSDDIFISHTGVSRGYFLRRTHPQHTLDPIRAAWSTDASPPDRARVWLHLRQYFQSLIDDSRNREEASKPSALTPREEEILLRLSKGYPDKQIAAGLNISSWTVHNHMKNIFRKLGVHTRTQAVLKYLQR